MKTIFDRMPISGEMKNPLNVLKAYLKRSRISTLMFSEKKRTGRSKKHSSVSIFPFIISLSCLVFCKCLIYTFSDIRTLLFVFFMASEIIRCEEKLFPRSFAQEREILKLIEGKLKFKDNSGRTSVFSGDEGLFLELFVRL
jgi:hypothetical protein